MLGCGTTSSTQATRCVSFADDHLILRARFREARQTGRCGRGRGCVVGLGGLGPLADRVPAAAAAVEAVDVVVLIFVFFCLV